MGYVFSSMLFLFLSLFPSVLMSTLLLRAKQTTAKEKRCPAARRRHLRPQGAVPAGAAERPPGPACALHPGGGRRAAGSFPPGRLRGAGGRSRLPPTVLGQRSSQRGPDTIVCSGRRGPACFPVSLERAEPPLSMASLSVGRGSTARSHGGVGGRGNEALPQGSASPAQGGGSNAFRSPRACFWQPGRRCRLGTRP